MQGGRSALSVQLSVFALIAAVFILMAMFWDAFRAGYTLLASDMNLGVLSVYHEGALGGVLGRWQAYPLAGFTGTGVASVLAVLHRVLPVNAFSDAFYPLMMLASTLALFWFAFRCRVGIVGALACGIVVMWSGTNLTLVGAGHASKYGTMALCLLSMLTLSNVASGRGWAWSLLAGLLLGLAFLEQQDLALFMGMFLGAYALHAITQAVYEGCGSEEARCGRGLFGLWVKAVLVRLFPVGLVALVIAGPTMLTAYTTQVKQAAVMEEDGAETSEQKWEYCTQWSLPPAESLDFVAPSFFGIRSGAPEGPYWGRTGQSAEWPATGKGFRNFRLEGLYIGIIPVGLAVVAVVLALGKVSGFRCQVSGGAGRGDENGPRIRLRQGCGGQVTRMDTDGEGGAGESGDLNRSSRRTLRGGEGEESGPEIGVDGDAARSPNRQSAIGNRQFPSSRRPDTIFWAAVCLITLLLSFGKYTPLYRLFWQLPMVHEIRNPNKHLHMFQIALGILAAFGLDGLMRAARSGERRLVRTVLWTSGAFAVTALAFWSAAGIVKGMTGVLQQRFVAGGWGQYAPVIVQNMWKALGHAGWMAAIGAVGVGAMAWGGFRFQVSGFRSQREEELATRERGEKRGFTPEATEGGRSRHKGTKGKRGIEQKNAKGAKGGDESLRGVLNCDGVQGGPTRVLQKRSPLAVFAIFCSNSRRAGSGDGARPSQKNAKGAKGVRGGAKPQSAIGIRQSAIFLASSAMVLAVAIDAVWYSRDYIKTVKVNEIVGKNMVTEFLKENLHGQRALLLSQQGFYNQWLGTLFPYHDIPAFNVFQMPRMPKDYKHFLDVVGRNPLRMWELAAVGYALGPASFWGQIQEQPDWRAAFEPVAGFNVYPNGDGVGVAPATREQPAQHAVFRFKRGLDRYTLVRSWREAGDDVVCEELAESDFDPRAEVLVAPEDWGKVSGFRFQVSGGEGSGEETGPRMDTDGAEGAGESGDLNRSSRRTLRGGEGEETGPQMGADRGEAPSPNRQSATGNRQSITTVVETIRSMRMTTSADGPRILLVSQKWDKDFVAEVDGQPAPVLRCNYLCLGVPVPAGQHDVLIRYAPDTWHLWIQGAGMLIGLGAAVSLVVARIRRWGV